MLRTPLPLANCRTSGASPLCSASGTVRQSLSNEMLDAAENAKMGVDGQLEASNG